MENMNKEEIDNIVFASNTSTTDNGISYSEDYNVSGTVTTSGSGSNITWVAPITTTGINQPLTSTTTWTTGTWETFYEEASKDELKKVMKNLEVQIELNGVMKKCKLSDLLDTGYLKLKVL